jgi:cell division septum initiation protein DivIVA
MPIKPEDIDPSKLPVTLRGYDREATSELLLRVAWDYRQALRAHEDRTHNDGRLHNRIEELEAQVATQQEEFTRAIASRDAQVDADAGKRASELDAEVAHLRRKLHVFETRDELTRALLQSAQRAAREVRESARQDAEAMLKAAHRRAGEIEHDAHASARHSTTEIERLRRLENDLRDRLRQTLEAVIGHNGTDPAAEAAPEPAPEPAPEHWPTTPTE